MPPPLEPQQPTPANEELFDQWLDAALAGDIEEPKAFCARHKGGAEMQLAIQRIADQLQPSSTASRHIEAGEPAKGSDLPHETLGEFRLLRTLGEGGMGTVYLAEQPSLDRLVALKVMRNETLASPSAQQRFDLEARAVARLRHPNVVTLFGSGEDQGTRFLVMELVPGRSLDEVFAATGGTMRSQQLVTWCCQIGEALATAHGEGIVHRDVKPSNIRIDPAERAVLLDFGLARDLLDEDGNRTMQFAGSPNYASPEQRRGDRDRVDERTDIYSLGVVLYEGVTGCLPYAGSTLEAIAQEAAQREPIPVRQRNPRIAQDLAIVIGKAMEQDPAARYTNMREFVDDLRAVLELRPVRAMAPSGWTRVLRWSRRHRGAVWTGSILTAVIVLVAALWLQSWFARQEQRREESARLLREASQEIDDYRARRDQFSVAAKSSYDLSIASRERYMTPDETAFLQLHSVHRGIHWASTDKLFASIAQKVRAAQDLTPDTEAVDKIWARFWFERWSDHRSSIQWRALLDFARDQVTQHDRDGEQREQMQGSLTVSIVTDPEGAEVHLFRSIEAADIGRTDPLAVVSELPGDRRMTRIPWPGPDSMLGVGPIRSLMLERDEYIVELRMPEHETVVLPLVAPYRPPDRPLHREYVGRLLPVGTTPLGFARVSDARGRWPGVFMKKHEVTCAEYLAFLNSDDCPEGARPPRPLGRAPWPSHPAKRYALPDAAIAQHPVVGVSWHDANAYAEWWNHRHELTILGVRYRAQLPTRKEWRRAGGAVNTPSYREYPFGNYFSPHWCKGRFSKPNPGLEPIGSYPADVSPYGVYDLAGGAAEWCRDFLDAGRTLMPLCGGSWQDSHAEAFRIDAVRGLAKGSAGLHTGFRLVWTPE